MMEAGGAAVSPAVEGKKEQAPTALESLARKFGFGSCNGMDDLRSSDPSEIVEAVRPFSGCIVDTITVTGNEHTNRKTIVREMATRQGERLNEAFVLRDSSYLRGMGYFSVVEIAVRPSAGGRCAVDVRVEERPGLFMKYPFPTVDYSIDLGVTYGFRWRVKNFRGAGEDLLLTYKGRPEKERYGGVTWSAPWLWDFRLRAGLSLFSYYRMDQPELGDFIKESYGAKAAVGFPLTRSLIRQLWLTPELAVEERVSRMTLPGNITGPEGIFFRQLLMSYGFLVFYDSRDNLVAPFRGVYTGFELLRYFSIHGENQQYTFYDFTGNVYVPFDKYGTLIMGISVDDREGDLPSFYRMKLGGKTDLRGFSNNDVSGLFKVTESLQWRKRIYGPELFKLPLIGKFDFAVNAVTFVDNGTVVENLPDLDTARFYSSCGFGFEVISPIQNIMRIEAAFSQGSAPSFYVTSRTRF